MDVAFENPETGTLYNHVAGQLAGWMPPGDNYKH